MNYKLSDLITAINVALNYPAITYDDVSLYLDMCIGEINTTLHTALRTFKEYIAYARESRMAENVTAVLTHEPTGEYAQIECYSTGAYPRDVWFYNTNAGEYTSWYGKFVYYPSTATSYTDAKVQDTLYGIYVDNGTPTTYEAHHYSDALCLWVVSTDGYDIDVTEFLPEDWITLFVIPYVCFKYTVRDGGVASTFAEEMEQGFQQLQETYDIPHAVYLPHFADRPAYRRDMREVLSQKTVHVGIMCGTRAIYEDMKHPREIKASFGSVYDRGGWGV